MGLLKTLVSISLFLYILVSLVKFFYKVWWKPLHIQKLLAQQGIKGPSYTFLHGNTKEVFKMTMESMKKPMGLTHDILPIITPHVDLWTKLYGRNFLCWHGHQPQLFLTEPDLIKEVLNNKHGLYPKVKPTEAYKMLFGDGIAMSEGKKWSWQRKLANHAFHVENLKGMIPTMIASVGEMLERWRHNERKEIELLEEFRVLTSDVICKTAFGSSYLEGQKIFDMLNKLVPLIVGKAHRIELPVIGKFIKSNDDREAEKLELGIRESFVDIIRRRKEKVQKGKVEGHGSDYLGLLVNANQDNEEGNKISIDDMIDECKTFYFAGHETTMTLLSWTILLLATHTDWQEKARKEVFYLFGDKHPNPEENNIARMKTMTMIINETLRLYPPTPDLRRTVNCQVRLGDILLPPNVDIIIPPLASQRDPQIWGEDAHLFKPDRFADGITNAAKNTNAYLPFGMGPRICVGLNFATIEAKVALSMILQRFTFTLSPSYMHSPVQYITTSAQHGIQIILHPL